MHDTILSYRLTCKLKLLGFFFSNNAFQSNYIFVSCRRFSDADKKNVCEHRMRMGG